LAGADDSKHSKSWLIRWLDRQDAPQRFFARFEVTMV
jgi:hypothetical protein